MSPPGPGRFFQKVYHWFNFIHSCKYFQLQSHCIQTVMSLQLLHHIIKLIGTVYKHTLVIILSLTLPCSRQWFLTHFRVVSYSFLLSILCIFLLFCFWFIGLTVYHFTRSLIERSLSDFLYAMPCILPPICISFFFHLWWILFPTFLHLSCGYTDHTCF